MVTSPLLVMGLLAACSPGPPPVAGQSLHGLWVAESAPAGLTLRIEAMTTLAEGKGVLGVARVEHPGRFEIELSETPERFDLWVQVDRDGDLEPEYHFLHPASPVSLGALEPGQPLRLAVDGEDLAQDFPPLLPGEPVPYYVPGGRPLRGSLSLEGGLTGCVLVELEDWSGQGPPAGAEAFRYREGPFRVDAPPWLTQARLRLRQDLEGDGRFDRAYQLPDPLELPPGGLAGFELHLGEADWEPDRSPIDRPPPVQAEPARARPR